MRESLEEIDLKLYALDICIRNYFRIAILACDTYLQLYNHGL